MDRAGPTEDFAEVMLTAGYQVIERIGQGGMAQVFRACDLQLDRLVALKRIKPDVAEDEHFVQRFIRESRSAAAVEHPHIIPIYRADVLDKIPFIAMRLVHGGDVQNLVSKHGQLPADTVAAIVSQMASALDAAHQAGLVHRDVKPANMLLGKPGHEGELNAYLSDFGLCKELDASSGLTLTGVFVGTPEYGSPEQFRGAQATELSDQYALGCSAFTMLAGRPPFSRQDYPTFKALSEAHINAPRPLVTVARADLSGAVDGVFENVLANDPGKRYRNCQDFARALAAALAKPPAPSTQNAGMRPQTPSSAEPKPRPRRQSLAMIASLAVSVSVLIAAGVLVAMALLDQPHGSRGPGGGQTLGGDAGSTSLSNATVAKSERVTSLTVSPAKLTIEVGQTVTVNLTGRLPGGAAASKAELARAIWAARPAGIVSVAAGTITGQSPGSATVAVHLGRASTAVSVRVRKGSVGPSYTNTVNTATGPGPHSSSPPTSSTHPPPSTTTKKPPPSGGTSTASIIAPFAVGANPSPTPDSLPRVLPAAGQAYEQRAGQKAAPSYELSAGLGGLILAAFFLPTVLTRRRRNQR